MSTLTAHVGSFYLEVSWWFGAWYHHSPLIRRPPHPRKRRCVCSGRACMNGMTDRFIVRYRADLLACSSCGTQDRKSVLGWRYQVKLVSDYIPHVPLRDPVPYRTHVQGFYSVVTKITRFGTGRSGLASIYEVASEKRQIVKKDATELAIAGPICVKLKCLLSC